MALKPLNEFRYMSFDVVGTLIDFEGGLVGSLTEIGRDHGVEVDADRALDLYRSARYMPDVGHFPDDLVRVYKVIAADSACQQPTSWASGCAMQCRPGRRFPMQLRRWQSSKQNTV